MQVAESVLNLCDDKIAKILNGKVIPGDRVFYPVKPHIGTSAPGVHQPDFTGKAVVFTIDATDKTDAERVEFLAQHIEKNGGKVACFISQSTPTDLQEYISEKFHSHVVDIKNPEDFMLPSRGINCQYLIAKEDFYFVYPTNYKKYVNLFKNCFQHGGISMEEMILPIVKLKGKGF